jgi:predicted dehydrogenase
MISREMSQIDSASFRNLKVGFLGLGLIGRQRLSAVIDLGVQNENITIFDPDSTVKSKTTHTNLCFAKSSHEFYSQKLDRIIIGTPHNVMVETATKSLAHGALVLLEKPMGRNLEEAKILRDLPLSENLSIGFNYRFMPGIIELKNLLTKNTLGSITSINLVLGHGGAPQDRGSWKLNPGISGGGALLDPGIHLIDLLLFLFEASPKDIVISGGTSWRGFWDTGIDESVSIVGYINSTMFQLNISLVWWRTQFKLIVHGTEGYFELEGRGRTDGNQTIRQGRRWAWLDGISQTESEISRTLAETDDSFRVETKAWFDNQDNVARANEGLSAMALYDDILRNLND